MAYWLDLFTGTTWEEFQQAGANTSGFRERNWKRAQPIKVGDIFLCYMVGVKRWVGALRVTSKAFRDDTRIWNEEAFPVRFSVEPLVILSPEKGIPMQQLEGRLSFYQKGDSGKKWSGYVRSSPSRYSDADGGQILQVLKEAHAHPIVRPVDPRQLRRSANLYKASLKQGNEQIETVVGVPVEEEDDTEAATPSVAGGPSHTEIQWRLLDLGSKMGLKVWAPKNDRGRIWNGSAISSISRLLNELPTNFDDITNGIVENIDVIWLSAENAIAAAFEVEHTSAVYSGLLRMSDLLTMQPNIDIRLYLVGPDDRYRKFVKEVPRPTFAYRKKPLYKMCGFLPYSKLCEQLDAHQDVIQYLRPEFLDRIASFYDPEDDLEP